MRLHGRRLRALAIGGLVLALIGFLVWLFAVNWRPSPASFPVQGIDVTEDQGSINWFAVRGAGAQFAYARATTGAEERDARFGQYWRGIYAAGLPRGALHVYSLCQLAADQAGNFVATVPRDRDQLGPAVHLGFHSDCKARPERTVVVGEIGRLLAVIERHAGKPAVLKVDEAFERRYAISRAFDRPLWSVKSFFPPDYFARPWALWQASGFRRIEGVEGGVNWDVRAP